MRLIDFIQQNKQQMQGQTPGINPSAPPVDYSRLLELQYLMQDPAYAEKANPRGGAGTWLENRRRAGKRQEMGSELANLQAAYLQEQARAEAQAAAQAQAEEDARWKWQQDYQSNLRKQEQAAKDNRPAQLKIAEAYGNMTPEERKNFLESQGDGESMVLYGPDGNPLFTKGIPPGALTSKNVGELQGQLLKAEDRAERLQGIKSQVDQYADSYFTAKGAAKAKIGALLDKAGIDAGQDLQDFNAERATLLSDLMKDFDKYRKEVTGAGASPEELKQLQKRMANESMGPDEIRAIMANELKNVEEEAARKHSQLFPRKGKEENTSEFSEGTIIDNEKTGQSLILQGGQWVPFDG